jgi:hypothetical protein
MSLAINNDHRLELGHSWGWGCVINER